VQAVSIKRLSVYAGPNLPENERARLHLEAGRGYYVDGDLRRAEQMLRESVNEYRSYDHERAVAELSLGVTLYETFIFQESMEWIRTARALFVKLRDKARLTTDVNLVGWYTERIVIIDKLLIDLATNIR
jgi:hypothetical protein